MTVLVNGFGGTRLTDGSGVTLSTDGSGMTVFAVVPASGRTASGNGIYVRR